VAQGRPSLISNWDYHEQQFNLTWKSMPWDATIRALKFSVHFRIVALRRKARATRLAICLAGKGAQPDWATCRADCWAVREATSAICCNWRQLHDIPLTRRAGQEPGQVARSELDFRWGKFSPKCCILKRDCAAAVNQLLGKAADFGLL
jgi:hypothetical protein